MGHYARKIAVMRAVRMRGRGMHRFVGDPGLFSGLKKLAIGRILKKVVPAVTSFLPGGGLVRGAIGIAGKIAKATKQPLISFDPAEAARAARMRGGLMAVGGRRLPGAGFVDPSVMGGPSAADWQRAQDISGFAFPQKGVPGLAGVAGRRRYRRMNPMNLRAANRAIRRIKAVRKIVRSIESSLPKARQSRGSAPPWRRRRAK